VFQSPKATSYVAPAEPIDVNQRYLVRVTNWEDLGVSKYADPTKPGPPPHRIRWIFRIGKLDGTPILDVDGNPYEHWDYTSNKTTKGNKTATARLWMEAFLGPLEDSEIDGRILDRLKGKVALALFEEVVSDGQDGQEATSRLRILRLAAYRPKGAAPKPEPKVEVEPEAVEVGF
jgi:hypothetical protein